MPFFYHDGHLWAGTRERGEDLFELVRSLEGPAYVYALSDIISRSQRLKNAFGALPVSLHYAMKANGNAEILQALARQGLGVDTVSGGEIEEALTAGFAPSDVIFSGVGKTRHELELAIRLEIKQINVESPQELSRVAEIAKRLGKRADVAFRMNPDVNPQTHPYITTGFRENKFGMDESFLPELKGILKRHVGELRLRGLTLHIGSQLLDLAPLEEAIEKTVRVFSALRQEGYQLDRFDIGGGLGIDYSSSETGPEFALIERYGRMVERILGKLGCEVLTEPGRILVARAGLLIGEVQYIKKTAHKTFAILDTGMHHLLRPALYQARHRVLPLEQRPNAEPQDYDIVGPICESSDFLARGVSLPELCPGDRIAIADAGAYGYSMASFYNRHHLPKEIVVRSEAEPA